MNHCAADPECGCESLEVCGVGAGWHPGDAQSEDNEGGGDSNSNPL